MQDASPARLVLASASPRRAELLASAGFEFDIEPADVDETRRAGEGAEAYVRRLAEEKARAAVAKRADTVVLAADTVVIVSGEILGKPVDPSDAARMLAKLSGRSHEVMTGVCVARGRHRETNTALTVVEFAPLSEAEIEWYVASGEPTDKAGAYAIQGLASRFVTRIAGSYSNVVGLPVSLAYAMLKRLSD